MGNFQNKDDKNLANELDYIAANYIINNKENIDLTKDKECIKMVEKVAALLQKKLNGLQSNYLLKTRIQPINENKEMTCTTMSTIAAFYVQIANLYAAITRSVYKAPEVQPQAPEVPLAHHTDGSLNNPPYNFCSERLKKLINGQDYDTLAKNYDKIKNPNAEMIINPNVCNKDQKNAINNLAMEPGIRELHTLYYDIYDINTGEFNEMSATMKKIYKNDVAQFYKYFYGENASLPENVLFFSDISLNEITSDTSGCAVNGIYNTPYKGTLSDSLFKLYASHIKDMEQRMKLNQNKLLIIFDELFTTKKEATAEGRLLITLHPDLNDRKLQRLTQTTRELILNLFGTCEKDYKDGLAIYQRIVDAKLQNFIQIKKKNINDKLNEVMFDYFSGGRFTPPSHSNTLTHPRKIAYDFDGVIHTFVGLPDTTGQRSALGNSLSQITKYPFTQIIAKIIENHHLGQEQFIVSARNNNTFIIAALRKFHITPAMIPDKNVLTAWSNEKWKMLGEKEINEFYDDSCIVIDSIQKHRKMPILKHLDKLYLVYPEKNEWKEIHKNYRIDLQLCTKYKNI
jgi:hypothetical protein